jgi:hypothetical protein
MKNLRSAVRLASMGGVPADPGPPRRPLPASRAGAAPGERSPLIEDRATAPAAPINPRREGPLPGCPCAKDGRLLLVLPVAMFRLSLLSVALLALTTGLAGLTGWQARGTAGRWRTEVVVAGISGCVMKRFSVEVVSHREPPSPWGDHRRVVWSALGRDLRPLARNRHRCSRSIVAMMHDDSAGEAAARLLHSDEPVRCRPPAPQHQTAQGTVTGPPSSCPPEPAI